MNWKTDTIANTEALNAFRNPRNVCAGLWLIDDYSTSLRHHHHHITLPPPLFPLSSPLPSPPPLQSILPLFVVFTISTFSISPFHSVYSLSLSLSLSLSFSPCSVLGRPHALIFNIYSVAFLIILGDCVTSLSTNLLWHVCRVICMKFPLVTHPNRMKSYINIYVIFILLFDIRNVRIHVKLS